MSQPGSWLEPARRMTSCPTSPVFSLFKLKRAGLLLLANHYTVTLGQDPEAPDSPKSDWTSLRLVSWVARRPLAEIEKIPGAPAIRKGSTKPSQLDREEEAALGPIQQALDRIRAEREETNGCAFPFCTETYPIDSQRAPGWIFCDHCLRRAVCPKHAAMFQDRFELMHEAGCDIRPTWQELKDQEAAAKRQKSDVITRFRQMREESLTALQRQRTQLTAKELLKEVKLLGLLAATADTTKAGLLEVLARFDSVRETDLDSLVLRSFGLPHSTQHERTPGPDKQYRQGFNFVDRENRDFYKLAWPYAVRKRDSVFLWDLMNFPLLNSHRWYQEVKTSAHDPRGLRHYVNAILAFGLPGVLDLSAE